MAKILKKNYNPIIAIMLIISLTFVDIIISGTVLVSYAIDNIQVANDIESVEYLQNNDLLKTGQDDNESISTQTQEIEGFEVQTTTLLGDKELTADDSVFEGEIIKNVITLTNNTGKDVTGLKVSVNQENAVIYDLIDVEVTNYVEAPGVKTEHKYGDWENGEKVFNSIDLKNGESEQFVYQATVNLVEDDEQQTFGTISVEADGIDKFSKETIKNNIKNGDLKISSEYHYKEEVPVYFEQTFATKTYITNISGRDLENVVVKINLSDNLYVDRTSDFIQFYYDDESKTSVPDDVIQNIQYDGYYHEITLRINNLGANDKIVAVLFANIRETDNHVSVSASANIDGDDENVYVSNKVEKEVQQLRKNITVSQSVNKEEAIFNNGDSFIFTIDITNNEDEKVRINIRDDFYSAFTINSAFKIKGEASIDLMEQIESNTLSFAEELEAKETIQVKVIVTVDALGAEQQKVTNIVYVDYETATSKAELELTLKSDINNNAFDVEEEEKGSEGGNEEEQDGDNGDTEQKDDKDTIVEENKKDADLEQLQNRVFDLKLDKYISSVVVQNKQGIKKYNYDKKQLAKVEIKSKYFTGSVVNVEYSINVTNEGDVEGYAGELIEYIPEGFQFDSKLNKDWSIGKDNYLHSTSLQNVKIAPGETKKLNLILTKTMTSNVGGSFINTAEIYKSSNELNSKDVDSTAGNKVNGEDDISSASVIISVGTGAITIVFAIFIALIVLAIVEIIIYKKKGGKKYWKTLGTN